MSPSTNSVKQAGRSAKNSAKSATNSRWFEYLARAGYIMSGLVHAMIGWISIRLATGSDSGEDADQSGALASFADAPAGSALLIIGGIAMIALALMHLTEIFFGGAREEEGKDKILALGKAAGKAVTYAFLAFTALRFGLGSGSDDSGGSEDAAEPFLASGVGRILVALVGIGIIAVGAYHVYKGLKKKFLEDLNAAGDANVSKAIEVTGMVGYAAKGVALVGVGVMVMWAAASVDKEKASGMDAAFGEILTLPAGGIMLIAIGVGFMVYGMYSVLRAKYQQF